MELENVGMPPKKPGVLDALRDFAEQETRYKTQNPFAMRESTASLSLQLEYYQSILKAYGKSRDKQDRNTLPYLKYQLKKIQAKLRPTLWNIIAYSPLVEAARLFLAGNYARFQWHEKTMANVSIVQMQSANLQSLQEALRAQGFSLSMEGPLQKMLQHDLDNFHLRYTEPRYANTDFVLHFAKIPGTDVYYFQKFDAESRPALRDVLNGHSSTSRRTVQVAGEQNLTAGQASALVNNRPVAVTADGAETWLTNAHSPRQSFDLEKMLSAYPIKELSNLVQKARLIESLKDGGRPDITLQLHGGQHKYKIEVTPALNGFHFYDKNGRITDPATLTKQGQAEKLEQSKALTQQPDQSFASKLKLA